MKTKFILLQIILLNLSVSSHAQITFQKTLVGVSDYGDGTSIQQTSDGGFIIAGFIPISPTGNHIYLVKTDNNGDTLWTRTFGGTNVQDYNSTKSVRQTNDGGYIVCGRTKGFGVGDYDVYLIRTDSVGILLWSKTFGGVGDDEGSSVRQNNDGTFIIIGFTNSFGIGGYNFYLIKTDSNGDSLWTKTYGGVNTDYGFCIQPVSDGGYLLAGWQQSFGIGYSDFYLIKTDSVGNLLWSKTYGGTNDESAYDIKQTNDGGFILFGSTQSFGAGIFDFYLVKVDSAGNLLWSKSYGGTDNDWGFSVQQTNDGGYIMAGWTMSFGAGNWDAFLVKADTIGNLIWSKTFGDIYIDKGYAVKQLIDGRFAIIGSRSSYSTGNNGLYLIMTDSIGNSGCNENTPTTVVNSPATQVSIPLSSQIISSSGGITTTPATITGSGGIVNTFCISVGINEIAAGNLFNISPNPSTGNFIISFERAIVKGKVEILNILGENVFEENIFNESKAEVKLNNISDGIYFVNVFDGEMNYCKKLIVEQD